MTAVNVQKGQTKKGLVPNYGWVVHKQYDSVVLHVHTPLKYPGYYSECGRVLWSKNISSPSLWRMQS